jgi:hypothetical protein
MSCYQIGNAIVCTGRGATKKGFAPCPWCSLPGTRPPLQLITEVHGGYCAPDFVCGRCGYEWNPEHDGRWRDQPDAQRQANIRKVMEAKS